MSPDDISAAVHECLSVAMRSQAPFVAAAEYLHELRCVHRRSEADIREVADRAVRELLDRARANK